MPNASHDLQKAVQARLLATPALVDLIGGAKVYDHVPHGARMPYIAHGETSQKDWSTGTEAGSEHTLTITVWSQSRGRAELHAIADAVRSALHLAPLVLDHHRLVMIRHVATDTERRDDGETLRALVKFRAVTEPL